MKPLPQTKVLFYFLPSPFLLFLPSFFFFFMNVQVKQESAFRNAYLVMGGARQPLCGENRLCPALINSPETARCTEAERLGPLCLFMTAFCGSWGTFHLRAAFITYLFSLPSSTEPTNTSSSEIGEHSIYTHHSSHETLGTTDDFRIRFGGVFLPPPASHCSHNLIQPLTKSWWREDGA